MPVSQAVEQPCSTALPAHVFASGSPGAGIVQKRQTSSPVLALYAAMKPRSPSSPPDVPEITRSLTTSGAEVAP